MSVKEIVNVKIDILSRFPTAAGFGKILMMACHTPFNEPVKEYGSLQEMLEDGFTETHSAYKMACAALANNPAPRSFCIGKRNCHPIQRWELFPRNLTPGTQYSIDLGPTNTFTYTVMAGDVVGTITAALTAAINASGIGYVLATDNGSHVLLEEQAPYEETFFPKVTRDLDIKDVTVECINETTGAIEPIGPALVADLNEVENVRDDFYYVVLNSNSQAEIEEVAAWAESRIVKFVTQTSDWDAKTLTDPVTSTSTDLTAVNSALVAAQYKRTWISWRCDLDEFHNASLAAVASVKQPGTFTYKFKATGKSSADPLRTGERSVLNDRNTNFYYNCGGQNIVCEGKMASGEFADNICAQDWLCARMAEGVYAVLLNNDKVPYNEAGISAIRGAMRAVLERAALLGVINGPITEDNIIIQNLEDIPDSLKAIRCLEARFTAQLAGAIHCVTICGTLNI